MRLPLPVWSCTPASLSAQLSVSSFPPTSPPSLPCSELCDLVKEVQPAARRPQARLSYAFVYPDRRGKNVMRQVGQVHASRFGEDDAKSLQQLNFQTGDFLSVAIY